MTNPQLPSYSLVRDWQLFSHIQKFHFFITLFIFLMLQFTSFYVVYLLTGYSSYSYFNYNSSLNLYPIAKWLYTYLYQWVVYFHMFSCHYLVLFPFVLKNPFQHFLRGRWWTSSYFVSLEESLLLLHIWRITLPNKVLLASNLCL